MRIKGVYTSLLLCNNQAFVFLKTTALEYVLFHWGLL